MSAVVLLFGLLLGSTGVACLYSGVKHRRDADTNTPLLLALGVTLIVFGVYVVGAA